MGRRRSANRGGFFTSVTAGICLALVIFALAVVLVLNASWLYDMDMRYLHLEQETGMSAAVIRANYDALIAYNRVWHQAPLAFPTLPMSETGAIHFQEVKRIFDGIQIMGGVCAVLSVLLLGCLKGQPKRRALRIVGVISLAVPAVLGILAALDWERFFVAFHHIFFHNDYWLFDPATDPVILILPDTYFLHCAIGILGLIVLGSLLCFLFSRNRRGKVRS